MERGNQTVKKIKRVAVSKELPKAFTFMGEDPEGPLSGDPVWIHFKDFFDCVGEGWIGYRKIVKKKGKSGKATAPAPPPPPMEAELSELEFPVAGDGKGVALCLAGQLRMLETTHEALRQHLIEGLVDWVSDDGNLKSPVSSVFAYLAASLCSWISRKCTCLRPEENWLPDAAARDIGARIE